MELHAKLRLRFKNIGEQATIYARFYSEAPTVRKRLPPVSAFDRAVVDEDPREDPLLRVNKERALNRLEERDELLAGLIPGS